MPKTTVKARKVSLQNPAYQAANSEDKSILDYAHGHITDPHGRRVEGQAHIACFYEYARECPVLCELAKAFQKRKCHFDLTEDRSIIQRCLGRLDETVLYHQWLWVDSSPYFPNSPWRDIPVDARPRSTVKIFPLPTLRLRELAHYAYKAEKENNVAFEEYLRDFQEAKTDQERASVNKMYSVQPAAVWREADANEIVAFFRLDTKLSKDRLQDCFKAWLDLPENSIHFEGARTSENTEVGTDADRLKDLAIWKLYRRLKNDCIKVREFLLDHRKNDGGKALVFLNDKPGRGKGGVPAIKAMERRSAPYFLNAVQRAQKHRKALFFFEGHQDREKEQLDDLSRRIDEHFGKFFDRRK